MLVDPLMRMLPKSRQSRNQSDSTLYGQLAASAYSVQDTDGSTEPERKAPRIETTEPMLAAPRTLVLAPPFSLVVTHRES